MRIRITGWRGTGDVPLSIDGALRRLALGVEHVVSEAEHEALKAAGCVVDLIEEAVEAVEELVTGEPPVTEAPADPPTTEAPATDASTTEAPETEAPSTEPPVTEAPVTEAPSAA